MYGARECVRTEFRSISGRPRVFVAFTFSRLRRGATASGLFSSRYVVPRVSIRHGRNIFFRQRINVRKKRYLIARLVRSETRFLEYR